MIITIYYFLPFLKTLYNYHLKYLNIDSNNNSILLKYIYIYIYIYIYKLACACMYVCMYV